MNYIYYIRNKPVSIFRPALHSRTHSELIQLADYVLEITTDSNNTENFLVIKDVSGTKLGWTYSNSGMFKKQLGIKICAV